MSENTWKKSGQTCTVIKREKKTTPTAASANLATFVSIKLGQLIWCVITDFDYKGEKLSLSNTQIHESSVKYDRVVTTIAQQIGQTRGAISSGQHANGKTTQRKKSGCVACRSMLLESKDEDEGTEEEDE
ncbi:hypothetical protein FQA39_LY05247 [Lamprigera yunnana]|nr:hypothetical protein FQA39_LY05247 [Lamprigera yunnana]